MNQRIFKTTTGVELELRRPSYRAFKNIAAKVAALLEVPFQVAMTTPEFDQVLSACVTQQLGTPDQEDGILAGMPFDDVARLWDAVIEHCEFPAFFAARQQRHFETSRARIEVETQLQAAQIQAMKNSGLLPSDFSLANAMTAEHPAHPASMPSSSTITPTSTDGRKTRSSTPTTGSSSGTSPRPRGAAKP